MSRESAIRSADELKPNSISLEEKDRWLSSLESAIKIENHGEDVTLVIPEYLEIEYVLMRIALEHGELEGYNKYAKLFNIDLHKWMSEVLYQFSPDPKEDEQQ